MEHFCPPERRELGRASENAGLFFWIVRYALKASAFALPTTSSNISVVSLRVLVL
jgi:hypothetical protein